MFAQHDVLTTADRQLLADLAARLEPHFPEIAAAWVEEVERCVPPRGIDAAAYRQMLAFETDRMLRVWYRLMAQGDFRGLYDFEYGVSREIMEVQQRAQALLVFGQRDFYLSGRIGYQIIDAWIDRLFVEDPVQTAAVRLAHTRAVYQLTIAFGESYSDAREEHLSAVSERLRRALDVSERLRTVGQAIAQSLDIEPVLDLMLRTAAQLTRADSAGLTLATADGAQLQLRSLIGNRRPLEGRCIPVDGTLTGWAYRQNQPARATHLLADERATRKDIIKERRLASVLVVPLRVGGKPIGTLGVSTRTERRFSDDDERLLQTLADAIAVAIQNARVHGAVRDALREAERASHAKSEFVAAVSHEIRSPLTVIMGYVELLREGAFGPPTADQVETLARVHRVAESTLALTSDLLEHARLEVGRLPIHLDDVDLAPVFEDLSGTIRVLIGERPIVFTHAIRTGAEQVRADPHRLRQILLNLLSNAAKFTDRGRIDLQAALGAAQTVQVTVRDTGVGIKPEQLPRIFELFYRANGAHPAGGAGIGLFLSRQLATLMHGGLTAHSTPGNGATFTLTLPAAARD
jgi:signal transduction histidine kinase